MRRWRWRKAWWPLLMGSAMAILFWSLAAALAQEPAPVAPTDPPIQVSEADALSWEKYQILARLAESQIQLLRLQNEKTLAEEFAKLDARFRAHYQVGVSELHRDGDIWRVRKAPTTK
mgnify:FL=1